MGNKTDIENPSSYKKSRERSIMSNFSGSILEKIVRKSSSRATLEKTPAPTKKISRPPSAARQRSISTRPTRPRKNKKPLPKGRAPKRTLSDQFSKLTLGNGIVLRLPDNTEPYRICFNEDALATIESGEGNRFMLDWETHDD